MTEKLGAYIQVTTEQLADDRALASAWAAALTAPPLTAEQIAERDRRRAVEYQAVLARHYGVRILADTHAGRRLEAVIALHAPDDHGYCQGCPGDEPTRWDDCDTIAAIKGDQ